MSERVPVPELGNPTVTYRQWSPETRSSEAVTIPLGQVERLEDETLRDALWEQFSTATYGDGSEAIVIYAGGEDGTQSYRVPTKPISL